MIFNFGVPKIHIESIRSAHTDTLYASTALHVMNENGSLHQDYPSKTVPMGDHKGKEEVILNLPWLNVTVPDPSSATSDGGAVYWTFLLTNAGHKDSGFETIASKAVDAYAGAFAAVSLQGGKAGVSGFLALSAVLGIQEMLSMLTADCDGVVAANAYAFTSKQLLVKCPTKGHVWSEVLPNPGTNSPAGCGSNSSYDVKYEIVRVA
jgi:hypothetical protein